MAHTNAWGAAYEAAPADSDNISEGAGKIRGTRGDIRERLDLEHYFELAGTNDWQGMHTFKVTNVSSTPHTITNLMTYLEVTCSTEIIVENLPAIATTPIGKIFIIKKIDDETYTVDVTANGADTIDGAASYSLTTQYDTITIINTGTYWHIIASSASSTGQAYSPRGHVRNLRIDPGATWQSQVIINVDEVILPDASTGCVRHLSPGAITLDITVSGVNGLSTDESEGSKWYYIWLISNGSTLAALLSEHLAIGDLTLPAGYTYALCISAVYNFTNFTRFYQRDDIYQYYTPSSSATGGGSVNTVTMTLATACPSYTKIKEVWGLVKNSSGSNGQIYLGAEIFANDLSSSATNVQVPFSIYVTDGDVQPWRMMPLVQSLYYQSIRSTLWSVSGFSWRF